MENSGPDSNKPVIELSSGIIELDEVIHGIRLGDNIVWQMDSIEDYSRYVHPYCEDAVSTGTKLVYFRFADHPEVIPPGVDADIYHLDPGNGFESFLSEIFRVIENTGEGAYYVFDSLSGLAVDWNSDRMLGNFFMLTCPYLYEHRTVACFALLRNHHSIYTLNAIQDTAQVVIDHYHKKGEFYIHPLKVDGRHSKTMYMLHKWGHGRISPITSSAVIAEILGDVPHPRLDLSEARNDLWKHVFLKAGEIQQKTEKGFPRDEDYEAYRQRLIRMCVTRDEQLIKLVGKYLDLPDLIDIGKHMIGTGLIGGKTVGMLLAQAILRKNSYWKSRLETHDSFYIGSDVFYSYLIRCKCWWIRWKQKNNGDLFKDIDEAREKLLTGSFPKDIKDQFREILNYFGQSPIVVRSSSLLEDAYGNSFSGKYESVFCANQGTPEKRLEHFMDAVKRVYASTMNSDALLYRYDRGLLDRDEQMALLVQRVSGAMYGDYYLPQIAGVGFSYNLYVWDKSIDPKAGVLRLVFGLGTRAVNRNDDDYTRIVAVDEPGKRPEAGFHEIRKYAQRKVDLLDLKLNSLTSEYFSDIVSNLSGIPFELFVSRDPDMEELARERKLKNHLPWILTFDRLFSDTNVIKDIGKMLKTLEEEYNYPVDIEFTVNFTDEKNYKINLLQCRPYQIKKAAGAIREAKFQENNLILRTHGPIIGASIHTPVDRLIYVVSSVYARLTEKDKYGVAALIGRIANTGSRKSKTTMLLGPGRWGSNIASLGVPVGFADIRNVSVLCEIAEMHEGLVPDVSLGTHFFNNLVELDILYMAVYPENTDNLINREFLNNAANSLPGLFPEAVRWSDAVRVIDFSGPDNDQQLYLHVNSVEQRGYFYRKTN
jgi:pyruvate, water dikinase